MSMDPRNMAVIWRVGGARLALQSVIFAWQLGLLIPALNMDVVGIVGSLVGGGRPGRGSRGLAGMIRDSALVVGI